jgi:uncharacterized protein (TIGR02466 family)
MSDMQQVQENQIQIHDYFGIPFVIINLKDLVDDSEIQKIINLQNDKDNFLTNEQNFTYKNTYLLTEFLTKESTFTKAVQSKIDFFIKEVWGQTDANIEITQSWLNINPPGGGHHKHVHPNSIISSTVYLQTNDKCGNFCIERPVNYWPNIRHNSAPDKLNKFTYQYYYFNPKFMDMFIFPSTLTHWVNRNESEETRLSLSLNTFYRDMTVRVDSSGQYSLTDLKV